MIISLELTGLERAPSSDCRPEVYADSWDWTMCTASPADRARRSRQFITETRPSLRVRCQEPKPSTNSGGHPRCSRSLAWVRVATAIVQPSGCGLHFHEGREIWVEWVGGFP